MNLDKGLNLVLTVPCVDGTSAYVHSEPVSLEVYEANYRLISRASVAMYSDGLGAGACARVAMLALRDTAKDMDAERGGNTFTRSAEALLQEIWRLSNVAMPTDQGWQNTPLHTVIGQKLLDPKAIREAQNCICFFTLASWFHQAMELENIYKLLTAYGAQTVSSNCTEFAASLQTSTQTESTGAMAQAVSMPV